MKLLIKGGRVINPGKDFDAVSDVLVENGKIVAIGENLEASDAKVIDAKGKVVAPGFIDMHTHLREPGQEAKEDFISAEKFSSGNFAERVEKIYEQQIRKYRYENAA